MANPIRTDPPSQPTETGLCFEPRILECMDDEDENLYLTSNTTPNTDCRSEDALALKNNNTVRLLANQAAEESLPIATFRSDDRAQQLFARDMASFLSAIDFDESHRRLHPDTYGRTPIEDTEITSSNQLPKDPQVTERQRLAVSFFMYGESLSVDEIHTLFGEHTDLVGRLEDQGLMVVRPEGADVRYRLNDLSFVSHRLPNGQVMILATDIPRRLSEDSNREPSAIVSTTSFILLKRLEEEHGRNRYRGVVADFGSGTGIQAMALLKMHPEIDEALAIEIDPHSINLSRFNAMLNSVDDRFTTVDNSNEVNFRAALADRKLDFAVSNPPFNVVPRKYASEFTDFGDGGPQGLGVTDIFLAQALPVLKPDGEFLLYSVLAKNHRGQFFATEHVRRLEGEGLSIRYDLLDDLSQYQMDRALYSEALADFLEREWVGRGQQSVGGRTRETVRADLNRELEKDGVASFFPAFWTVRKRNDDTRHQEVPVAIHHRTLPAFAPLFLTPEPQRGGVRFEEFTTERTIPYSGGGERITFLYPPMAENRGGTQYSLLQSIPLVDIIGPALELCAEGKLDHDTCDLFRRASPRSGYFVKKNFHLRRRK